MLVGRNSRLSLLLGLSVDYDVCTTLATMRPCVHAHVSERKGAYSSTPLWARMTWGSSSHLGSYGIDIHAYGHVHGHADMCRHVFRYMYTHLYAHAYRGMCTKMCMDTCVALCSEVYANTSRTECAGMFIDMCSEMNLPVAVKNKFYFISNYFISN